MKAGRANNTEKKTLNGFLSILFLLNTLIKFVYLCLFLLYLSSVTQATR